MFLYLGAWYIYFSFFDMHHMAGLCESMGWWWRQFWGVRRDWKTLNYRRMGFSMEFIGLMVLRGAFGPYRWTWSEFGGSGERVTRDKGVMWSFLRGHINSFWQTGIFGRSSFQSFNPFSNPRKYFFTARYTMTHPLVMASNRSVVATYRLGYLQDISQSVQSPKSNHIQAQTHSNW
jgi:hypothetical protein